MEQVAIRELFEETGLHAKNLQLFDIFSGQELYYRYPHGDEVYNVVAAYICHEYDGKISIDKSEVEEVKFFAPNQLPSNINPPDKIVLSRYINSK